MDPAKTWWRHQMETFSALLALCARNSPVPGEFPAQRPVMRSFVVFFDLRPKNGWINNGEAGDLRRYCTQFDVIVLSVVNSARSLFSESRSLRAQCRSRYQLEDVDFLEADVHFLASRNILHSFSGIYSRPGQILWWKQWPNAHHNISTPSHISNDA